MNKEIEQILNNQSAIMSILFHGQMNSRCRDEIIQELDNTSNLLNPEEKEKTSEEKQKERTEDAFQDREVRSKFGTRKE